VGILANIVPGDPVSAFRHGLTLIISLIAGAGLVAGCMLTGRPVARELAASATEGYVK
jgi:hypothetical protein